VTSHRELSDGAHSSSWPWRVCLAVAAYLLIAGYIVFLCRSEVGDPDAVAYVQIARHYAQGRLDLAVSSWWAPLFSWLLVPAVWAGIEPLVFGRILGVLFGLGFALAVAAVVREMKGDEHRSLAFVAALMLALIMLLRPLMPDFLLTCLLTWYFVLTARLLKRCSLSRSFATGFLGGCAYLAKAYALPFITLHLCLTFTMRRWLVRRGLAEGQVLKPFAMAVAGLLLVCLPWVARISAHDGVLTISGSGRYDLIPVRAAGLGPLPYKELQRLRSGRITSWENPMEVPYDWPSASKVLAGVKFQLATVFRNFEEAFKGETAAGFGILLLGLLAVTFILLFLRQSLSTTEFVLCCWAFTSVAIYVGGYILLHVRLRYLFPVSGISLALFVHALGWLRKSSDFHRSEEQAEECPALTRRIFAAFRRGLTGLLVVSIGGMLLFMIAGWHGSRGKGAQAHWLKKSARGFGITGRVAANVWSLGLYMSYWSDSVFLGEFGGDSPEAIAKELTPFGQTFVLVFYNKALADKLEKDPLFKTVGVSADLSGNQVVYAFEFSCSQECSTEGKPLRLLSGQTSSLKTDHAFSSISFATMETSQGGSK